MHRREVLQFLGAAAIAPVLAPLTAEERWFAGVRLREAIGAGQGGSALSADQMALLTALADTLIPRTDTPGALDVDVPRFVDHLVASWYPDAERAEIVSGLEAIDARAMAIAGSRFAALDAAGRGSVITTLDRRANPGDPAEATWRRLRDAIVFGYVTSQPIAAMLATTPMIPGRFEGCVPVGTPR